MDLYRLADEEEAERSGIADMLHDPVLTLVEWPERIPGLMPDDAWMVRLDPVDGGGRSCILSHL
jgi:tRNA threonylcarbamoyladenosine biosynthesis protein TsaE